MSDAAQAVAITGKVIDETIVAHLVRETAGDSGAARPHAGKTQVRWKGQTPWHVAAAIRNHFENTSYEAGEGVPRGAVGYVGGRSVDVGYWIGTIQKGVKWPVAPVVAAELGAHGVVVPEGTKIAAPTSLLDWSEAQWTAAFRVLGDSFGYERGVPPQLDEVMQLGDAARTLVPVGLMWAELTGRRRKLLISSDLYGVLERIGLAGLLPKGWVVVDPRPKGTRWPDGDAAEGFALFYAEDGVPGVPPANSRDTRLSVGRRFPLGDMWYKFTVQGRKAGPLTAAVLRAYGLWALLESKRGTGGTVAAGAEAGAGAGGKVARGVWGFFRDLHGSASYALSDIDTVLMDFLDLGDGRQTWSVTSGNDVPRVDMAVRTDWHEAVAVREVHQAGGHSADRGYKKGLLGFLGDGTALNVGDMVKNLQGVRKWWVGYATALMLRANDVPVPGEVVVEGPSSLLDWTDAQWAAGFRAYGATAAGVRGLPPERGVVVRIEDAASRTLVPVGLMWADLMSGGNREISADLYAALRELGLADRLPVQVSEETPTKVLWSDEQKAEGFRKYFARGIRPGSPPEHRTQVRLDDGRRFPVGSIWTAFLDKHKSVVVGPLLEAVFRENGLWPLLSEQARAAAVAAAAVSATRPARAARQHGERASETIEPPAPVSAVDIDAFAAAEAAFGERIDRVLVEHLLPGRGDRVARGNAEPVDAKVRTDWHNAAAVEELYRSGRRKAGDDPVKGDRGYLSDGTYIEVSQLFRNLRGGSNGRKWVAPALAGVMKGSLADLGLPERVGVTAPSTLLLWSDEQWADALEVFFQSDAVRKGQAPRPEDVVPLQDERKTLVPIGLIWEYLTTESTGLTQVDPKFIRIAQENDLRLPKWVKEKPDVSMLVTDGAFVEALKKSLARGRGLPISRDESGRMSKSEHEVRLSSGARMNVYRALLNLNNRLRRITPENARVLSDYADLFRDDVRQEIERVAGLPVGEGTAASGRRARSVAGVRRRAPGPVRERAGGGARGVARAVDPVAAARPVRSGAQGGRQVASGWAAGVPAREYLDEESGDAFGEFYFRRGEAAVRRPHYEQLRKFRHVNVWAHDEVTYRKLPLPFPSGGKVYFVGAHGWALEDRGRAMREVASRVADDGFTDVVMWACPNASELTVDSVAALPVVEGERVRYHYFSGEVAVDANGLHLLPGTVWLVRHPDGRVERHTGAEYPRQQGGVPFPDRRFVNTAAAPERTESTGEAADVATPHVHGVFQLPSYLADLDVPGMARLHDLDADAVAWVADTVRTAAVGGDPEPITSQLAAHPDAFVGKGLPFQVRGKNGTMYDVKVSVTRDDAEARPLIAVTDSGGGESSTPRSAGTTDDPALSDVVATVVLPAPDAPAELGPRAGGATYESAAQQTVPLDRLVTGARGFVEVPRKVVVTVRVGPVGRTSPQEFRIGASATSAVPVQFLVPSAVSAAPAPANAVTSPDGVEARAGEEQAAPAPRAPWYVEHGMLGEAEVTHVPDWTREQADQAATSVLQRLDLDRDLSEDTRAAIRAGVRDLLLEKAEIGGKGKAEEKTRDRWLELLLKGRLLDTGGRLVWLRPVLDSVVHHPPTGAEQPERQYNVTFSGTASATLKENISSTALDDVLYSAVNIASTAASAGVIGVPQLVGSAAATRQTGSRSNVISGRKLFVGDTHGFTGGLRFRIFVDGVEQHPHNRKVPATVGRGLGLKFPAEYSGPKEPRPDIAQVSARKAAVRGAYQAPRRGGDVLNAIDLTNPVADLQRELVGQGVAAAAAKSIVEQAQMILNERTARGRYGSWGAGGDPGVELRAGGFLPGGKRFSGYPRVRTSVRSLQFLHVAQGVDGKGVQVRDDMGGGWSTVAGLGGTGGGSITVGYNTTGLADPSLLIPGQAVAEKGIAPLLGLTLGHGRDWGHTLTSQGLGHTILNTTADQARYRAGVKVVVEMDSRTHPGVKTLTSVVPAELGLPWRGGQGAADLEQRVLGEVTSPFVRGAVDGTVTGDASEEGPAVWPAPVQAQPHVRALLETAGLPPSPNHVSARPPAGVGTVPGAHRRDPHEPLALAARKGTGYAEAVALPGAEMVEDLFRSRLRLLSGPRSGWRGTIDKLSGRRDPGRGRSAADRQLSANFGRPALEASLSSTLAGFKEEVTYGGVRYELGVRGHLMDHLQHSTYKMKVDSRALIGETVEGSRSTKRWLSVGAGGGLRLDFWRGYRLQIGGARGLVKYLAGKGEKFVSAAKSYRRMATTADDDSAHEHVYNMAYLVTMRPADEPGTAAEHWWVHDPGNVVAQVVVADQHVPLAAPDQAEVRQAGEVTVTSQPPSDEHLDLSGGTSGLYPAFMAVPELAETAARLYFRINGLPEADAEDFAKLPKEIVNATRPNHLEEYFAKLAQASGHDVALPRHGDWTGNLNLQLVAHAPRELPTPKGDTEIEDYVQSAARHPVENVRTLGVEAQVGLGPVFKFGSDEGGDVEVTEPGSLGDDGVRSEGSTPGGRLMLLGHANAGKERGRAQGDDTGAIEISRATYSGKPVALRTDPVIKVTVTRRKGRLVEQQQPVYLRAKDAMDLLVPPRRMEDIAAPGQIRPVAPEPERKQSRERTRLARPPRLESIPEVDELVEEDRAPQPAPVTKRYVGGQVPVTSVYPERLRADAVLEQITTRLKDRGIIETSHLADGTPADAPDLLTRSLGAIYSSEAMRTQLGPLRDQGLWAWLPIRGFGGSTQYLYVNVKIDLDAAKSNRPRDDVRLTLRAESTAEHKNVRKDIRNLQTGAALSGRGGADTEETNQQGHGGGDVGFGYINEAAREAEVKDKTTTIVRANTKDASEEFEHDAHYTIELGTVREMPEILKLLALPGNAFYAVTAKVARRFGRKERLDERWNARRPWIWHDSGEAPGQQVAGDVRLIVPRYLTETVDVAAGSLPDQPQPPVLARNHGQNPRWTDAAAPAHPATDALLENLHPWDVSAAFAVNRWAKVALLRAAREPRLDHGTPWDIAGIDFTTTRGLAYNRSTSGVTIRPRIQELLGHSYEVTIDGRKVTVGFELSNGKAVSPEAAEVKHKARRYRQDDAETQTQSDLTTGWYRSAGPEGGGGEGDDTFLLRALAERAKLNSDKHVFGQSEIDEHNKESTRNFRYYTFDVTAVFTPAHKPTRQLRVDVPGGLVAMFPLTADGSLAGDLLTLHPEIFATPTAEDPTQAAPAPSAAPAPPTPSAAPRTEPGPDATAYPDDRYRNAAGDSAPQAARQMVAAGDSAAQAAPQMVGALELPDYLLHMDHAGGAQWTAPDPGTVAWMTRRIRTETGGDPTPIMSQLASRPEAFVGSGLTFQVRGRNGAMYDVTVSATSADSERKPLIAALASNGDRGPSVSDVRSATSTATLSSSSTHGWALPNIAGYVIVPTPVPGLLAGAAGAFQQQFGRTVQESATQQTLSLDRLLLNLDGSVEVPRQVTFRIRIERQGLSVPRVFDTVGSMTSHVPVNHLVPYGTKTGHTPFRKLSAQTARAVAFADSLNVLGIAGNDGLFDVIRSVVRPRAVTDPGAPGRQSAFDAASAAHLADNLPDLLQGEQESGELTAKDGRVGAGYRMRAELVAMALERPVGPAISRGHEGIVRSHSETHGRGVRGGRFGLGPAFGAQLHPGGPAARASLVPTVQWAAQRTSSHSSAHGETAGRHIGGDRLLYRARVRVVASEGGREASKLVTAWLTLRPDEALALGLAVPGDPTLIPPLQRHPGFERYLPFGAKSPGVVLTKVDTTELRSTIDAVFAQDPRLAGFLPASGAGGKGGWTQSESDRAMMRGNRRALSRLLKSATMTARKGALLGGSGIAEVLRVKGLRSDTFVKVRVKARTGPERYLGDMQDWQTRSIATQSVAVQAGESGEEGVSVMLSSTGKLWPDLDQHLYVTGHAATGVQRSYRNQAGPRTEGRQVIAGVHSSEATTPSTSAYDVDLRWDVEITQWKRPRTWARRVTPGTPGRQVPAVVTIASTGADAAAGVRRLEIAPVVARLTVPIALTVSSPPAGLVRPVGEARPVPVPRLDGINGMYEPAWSAPSSGNPVLKHAVAWGFVGDGTEVTGLARELLAAAAGGDEALTADQRLEEEFGAGALPAAMDRGVARATGLKYKRRAGTLAGAVAGHFRVESPSVVEVLDKPAIEQWLIGAQQALGAKGSSRFAGVAFMAAGAGSLLDQVFLLGGLVPGYGRSRARQSALSSTAAVERALKTAGGHRLVMVQADLRTLVAAEARQGLLPAKLRTGGRLLTGAVVALVTEPHARALGLGDQVDRRLQAARTTLAAIAEEPEPAEERGPTGERVPAADGRHSSVPAAGTVAARAGGPAEDLVLAGHVPLSLGALEHAPDFARLLTAFRAAIEDRNSKLTKDQIPHDLLPLRALDDRWDNTARLNAVLEGATGLLNDLDDDGVWLVLHDHATTQAPYWARLVLRRQDGTFRHRPASGLTVGTATSVQIDQNVTEEKGPYGSITVPTVADGFLPSNGDGMAGVPGVAASGQRARASGVNRSLQSYVQVTVSDPDKDGLVTVRVPVDGWLELYRSGSVEDARPILSVRLEAPAALPGGQPVEDDRYLLWRLPESDLRAFADVRPPRTVPEIGAGDTEPVDRWRAAGVPLPAEAQASFRGARAVRLGMAELARRLGASSDFSTIGESPAYTLTVGLSSAWLTAALPVLVNGLALPQVFARKVLGRDDLGLDVFARLTDGEVIGVGKGADFEVVAGQAPGVLRLVGSGGNSGLTASSSVAAQGLAGPSWMNYGLDHVHDDEPTFSFFAGSGTDSASASGSGNATMQFSFGEPWALLQFTLDFRLVGRLVGRLGGRQEELDVPMARPVLIRMTRDAAARLLSAGRVTDPRHHVLRSLVVVNRVLDAQGRHTGLSSYIRQEAAERQDALPGASELHEYTRLWRTADGTLYSTRRLVPRSQAEDGTDDSVMATVHLHGAGPGRWAGATADDRQVRFDVSGLVALVDGSLPEDATDVLVISCSEPTDPAVLAATAHRIMEATGLAVHLFENHNWLVPPTDGDPVRLYTRDKPDGSPSGIISAVPPGRRLGPQSVVGGTSGARQPAYPERIYRNAVGLEVEDHHVVGFDPEAFEELKGIARAKALEAGIEWTEDDERDFLPGKVVLAKGTGVQVVTEQRYFFRSPDTGLLYLREQEAMGADGTGPGGPQKFLIAEFVLAPMDTIEGERRELTTDEGLALLEQGRRALGTTSDRNAPRRFSDLLPAGWQPTQWGQAVTVFPSVYGSNHPAYAQPTYGVPAIGLRALLDLTPAPPLARPLFELSRRVGETVTMEFVRQFMGTPDLSPGTLPFLSAIPDVDDMWGYVWSGFNHIAARPTAAIATSYVGKTLIKGWLPLALRLAPDLVLPAVRPRTRMDFNDRLEAISETFIDALMTLVERRNLGDPAKPPLDRGIFDVQVGSTPSPREHIAAVLTGRTSQGTTINQWDAVDMDDFPQLDTADGRVNQALLLGAGRHWAASAPLLAPEGIHEGLTASKQFGREAYRQAEKYPAPLPDDVLRESVRRVVEHPAVQKMARFLASARVGGKPLDPVVGTRLARDIGLFALGEPLPSRTREQLAALVDKVADNLPTAPPEARDHLRSVVAEAREALAVLDREPPSAYAQENWTPHIVTVDGRRAALGELRKLSHRGPQGDIVGVSSRSRSLTDGRLDTYRLAPLAKQYTRVRRVPRPDDPSHAEVTAESTPQAVPFEAPYVVGVKGDADTVRLALESGGEREFSYLRLVDFLFATDPVLTALPRGASVLVMGADVAGPPSHDPLSQPLAGQLLSNLWNRPVWGTSSGDEPVIVPGDAARGIPARFQLAEGDRWVGFRPEPSTVELGRIAREVLPDQAARAADVLRWVRAIRLVHGPLLEKDDTATFHALLRGFWALEHWRRRGGDEEPLTWAHLRQLTARHHAALGGQEPALAPALAVLLTAATASLGFHLPLDPTAAVPRYHSRLSESHSVPEAIAARRSDVVPGLFGEHITDSMARAEWPPPEAG